MEFLDTIINVIINLLAWPIKNLGLFITGFIGRGPNETLPKIRDDFLKLGAVEVAKKIRNQELSAVEVVKACIRRIEDINGTTNCVVVNRFDEAIKEAEAADAFIIGGSKTLEAIERETPFLGVPFSVKDGIAIKGAEQTAGMVRRKGRIAEKDAATVALMRTAGAIPIATTNVPEGMMWWESSNLVYGRTKNPYHSQYTPAGSSGGEGTLLSSAGSFMGLGSDLGGSIRLPSYMCGIFGHLPSRKIIDATGHYPSLLPHQEIMASQGPMSKSAKDLRPMLQILTQPSNIDLKLDEDVDIKKLRYFYMESDGGCSWVNGIDPVDRDVKGAIKSVVEYFSKTYGITLIKVNIDEMKRGMDLWWARAIKQKESDPYLAETANELEYSSNAPLEILKGIFGLSEHTLELMLFCATEKAMPPYGSPKQIKNQALADKFEKTLKDLLRDDGVFIYPTQPTKPIKHRQTFFRPYNISYTCIFNATQFPVTQCPITQTDEGLPIGIQVVAAPFQDRLTLAVAEELEKAFGGWRPPPGK